MKELDDLISLCISRYNNINCKQCVYSQCKRQGRCDCYECIKYIHRTSNNTMKYNCEKMIYNYVIKHFYRYASEIYYQLMDLNSLMTKDHNLHIVSLGCGAAPELYGILLACRNYKTPQSFNFIGFDHNEIWSPIWNLNKTVISSTVNNIEFIQEDMFDFYNNHQDEKIDILLLNYFLSDIAKFEHTSINDYLDKLCDFICSKSPIFILFNDIPYFDNSLKSGCSCIEYIRTKLTKINKNIKVVKHVFKNNINNYSHQFENGSKIHTSSRLKFTIDPDTQIFDPFDKCNSIQETIEIY